MDRFGSAPEPAAPPPENWSGGRYAHADSYYANAKVSQKGDPFFGRGVGVVVVVVVERGGATAKFKVIPENDASHFPHCYLYHPPFSRQDIRQKKRGNF